MTSTHLDPPHTAVVEHPASDSIASGTIEESSSVDSSFSDAYKEQVDEVEGYKSEEVNRVSASDDYAMTFESEGEPTVSEGDEHSDSQDVSQANVEQDAKSLPTIPATDSSSPLSHIAPVSDTNSIQANPSPTLQPTADPAAAHLPETTIQTETTKPHTHTYDDIANGGVDIQALLDNITANAEKNEAASSQSTPLSANPSSATFPKGASSLPAHASLPPRPQVARPGYPYKDEISKYHAGPTTYPQPPNTYKPPPGVNVPLVSAGAPGTSTDPRGGLPPPPTASFRQPAAESPISPAPGVYSNAPRLASQDRPTQSIEGLEESNDADVRWGPDVQKKYDDFLIEERMYVTEGQWDRFPVGSRLFIGNLPSEKVTKRDIFHVFHKYGRLAQVAIKQAYGFVQFHDTAACYTALAREQGAEVRGRKMHLEISKPQKNTRNAQQGNAQQTRRSRSPDYSRGDMAGRGGRQGGRGQDRFNAHGVVRDEYGRILRGRDDYRPGRSPSPPRGNFRGRDDYGPARGGRDSYVSRRSRSRSPYDQRENRYRDRNVSPRRREANEDADLQIPRREPHNVPDVQIILMTQLDRDFVSWVENELRGRGLKSEVLFLSPRLPLDAVIRRQILEGVHAVSQLDMQSQNSSKIALQVFDRQGGANNVRFDEYQNLDPKIAAELVLRAKSQAAPVYTQPPPQAVQPQYNQQFAQPQYAPQPVYQPPLAPAPAPAPNLANLVGQLDNASLQKLLGSLTTPQQQNTPAVSTNSSIDLAGLLGGLKAQQPQPQYQQPDPYANPAISSYLGNAIPQPPQAPPQQSAQQVQNIMAQLAKFRQ